MRTEGQTTKLNQARLEEALKMLLAMKEAGLKPDEAREGSGTERDRGTSFGPFVGCGGISVRSSSTTCWAAASTTASWNWPRRAKSMRWII